MPKDKFESWGRYPRPQHLGVVEPESVDDVQNMLMSDISPLLPRGAGRSYGDSCLNDRGYLVLTSRLTEVRSFDLQTGVIRCECGVTFDHLLARTVPMGWFLPVTPGTKFVTVGGAIANDVHGKNHHRSGSFGNHVLAFELLRSDGTAIRCSRTHNKDWFHATIGGLGLTGLLVWADVQLKRVDGPYVNSETIRFGNLSEFADLSKSSRDAYEYTVAWIDVLASGAKLGRGVFFRGNHSELKAADVAIRSAKSSSWTNVPWDMPEFLLSPLTVKIFNSLYYHKHLRKLHSTLVHYDGFFYPLDGIQNWNRLYGRRGFLQWQCVIPFEAGYDCIAELLAVIAKSRLGSFLVVMKEFGTTPAEGMLSFPAPGITLALDFANVGSELLQMLSTLDMIVLRAKGRIYPAKDARMTRDTFRASFPKVEAFRSYLDPKFSSSFWRRVYGGDPAPTAAKL
jgi:FAD/FMN-containing dehydrogenase